MNYQNEKWRVMKMVGKDVPGFCDEWAHLERLDGDFPIREFEACARAYQIHKHPKSWITRSGKESSTPFPGKLNSEDLRNLTKFLRRGDLGYHHINKTVEFL